MYCQENPMTRIHSASDSEATHYVRSYQGWIVTTTSCQEMILLVTLRPPIMLGVIRDGLSLQAKEELNTGVDCLRGR